MSQLQNTEFLRQAIWTPILAGVCTLRELQEYYSLEDLFEMLSMLSFKVEKEREASESALRGINDRR